MASNAQRLLNLGLVLTIVLAGCVGGDDAAPDDVDSAQASTASAANATDAPADVATGSIVGQVMDDEALPIPGAEVALIELELEVVTDESGRFEFVDLPLAKHTLSVSKLGFESKAAAVELTAEAPDLEKVMELARLVVEDPYHLTQVFNGYMTCGAALVPWCGILDELEQEYGTPNPTEERWLFRFQLSDPREPENAVFETVWERTTGVTAEQLIILAIEGFSGQATGPSGFQLIVGGGDFADVESDPETRFAFGIYPELIDPVVYQKFDVYMTHFYVEPSPEGWSVFPPE